MKDIFKYIVAKEFFPVYAPAVRRFTYKMRGMDQNDQPIAFTLQDKIEIAAGIKEMGEELSKKIVDNYIREEDPTFSPDQKDQKISPKEKPKDAGFFIAKPPRKK